MKNLILLAALLPSYSFALTTDLCVSQRDTNTVVVQDTTSDSSLQISKDLTSGKIAVKAPVIHTMGGGGGIGTSGRTSMMAVKSKFNEFVSQAGVTLDPNSEVQNVVSQLQDCDSTN